jgi:hypothetical protein
MAYKLGKLVCLYRQDLTHQKKIIFHFDESANLVILSVEFRILYETEQDTFLHRGM